MTMRISMSLAAMGAITLMPACDSDGASNHSAANSTASAAPGGNTSAATPAPAPNAQIDADANSATASPAGVLRTETVSGTFIGWDMGDYLWAKVAVPGSPPIDARIEAPEPTGLFLAANVGRPVTVEVQTVMMHVPEAGGEEEIRLISAARNAEGTAESWWRSLSAADRAEAERRFQGALDSGGGD
jgi:hypothetical protein